MKIIETMCHSHLLSMLLQPEKFECCIRSYKATAPNIAYEGMAGYMETHVEFDVSDIKLFSDLWEGARSYPSNRSAWYHTVRAGLLKCGGLG